jgi:ELWxxDGT repeat protein
MIILLSGRRAVWRPLLPLLLIGLLISSSVAARSDATSRSSVAAHAPLRLVKDLNPTQDATLGSDPHQFTAVGATMFFIANDGMNGAELWKSDGTAAGAQLVRDINPGPADGLPGFNPGSLDTFLLAVNTTLFFIDGIRLWRSDGAAAGTVIVKDFTTLVDGVYQSLEITALTHVGDTLFLVLRNSDTSEQQLWRSDGTAAGTIMLKTLNPIGGASEMIAFQNMLFFSDNNQLWRSDGAVAGTELVADAAARDMTALGDTLFFKVNSSWSDYSVWKTDGTTAGTQALASFENEPADLELAGNLLFFKVNHRLWRSDGTAAGTFALTEDDFWDLELEGSGDLLFFERQGRLWRSDGTVAGTVALTSDGFVDRPIDIDGTLVFFWQDVPSQGAKLWTSDGTAAGTRQIQDLIPAVDSGQIVEPTVLGGLLYFILYPDASQTQRMLWRSDGTTAGTLRIYDHAPGSLVNDADVANGRVFFSANDPATGRELWSTDGTAAGTGMLTQINEGFGDSNLYSLVDAGGRVFFTQMSSGPQPQTELWTSDGTAAGTIRLKADGLFNTGQLERIAFNHLYCFEASSETSGEELWCSDGTVTGTTLVKDIRPGSDGSDMFELTVVGDTLFFTADDGVHGRELWRSDGTAEGTRLVKEIISGMNQTGPHWLTAMNGALYFLIDDSRVGPQLWKSDSAGAERVANLAVSPRDASIFHLINANGTLYFFCGVSSSVYGPAYLWRSDGSAAGTFRVTPAPLGGSDSRFNYIAAVGDRIFFDMTNTEDWSSARNSLWTSDGTASGTRLLKHISPGSMTAFNDILLFTASDETHGRELWRSDGTPDGTQLIKDIMPGQDSGVVLDSLRSLPLQTLPDAAMAAFTAMTPETGAELWRSDGTAEGTQLIEDLAPGPASSAPGRMTLAGTSLFFTADQRATGRELWALSRGSQIAARAYLPLAGRAGTGLD